MDPTSYTLHPVTQVLPTQAFGEVCTWCQADPLRKERSPEEQYGVLDKAYSTTRDTRQVPCQLPSVMSHEVYRLASAATGLVPYLY